MALSIKHPAADQLARELAEITGVTMTQAVIKALEEQLKREKGRNTRQADLKDELTIISQRCAALPVIDDRRPDVILGYDQDGLPR